MGNFGYVAVGIIVALVATGGLLYMFYARSNAVEKTGSGALIMLAVVSLMIPVFWIVEGNNQASAKEQQHTLAVQRGAGLYAQYCIDNCYAIQNNKVVNPKYNGYTIDALNQMSDDDLHRVIAGGVYNHAVPLPANPKDIVSSQDFNGPLSANDVEYLFEFLRSSDTSYLKKNDFYPSINGFNLLPSVLQNGIVPDIAANPAAYATAVALGTTGQFGQPKDMTAMKSITINITNTAPNQTCNPSCFDPINIKVKVGTKITWVNKSSVGHTVVALYGDGSSTAKLAPQLFDSRKQTALIETGQSFTYTVAPAAYTFNAANHTVVYFCSIHPTMLAELTIAQ
ncbi:MAG: hypothetical protein NVS4B11_04390 [Ktedonobacteraceae bacterium]